jgi:hypothetical protein
MMISKKHDKLPIDEWTVLLKMHSQLIWPMLLLNVCWTRELDIPHLPNTFWQGPTYLDVHHECPINVHGHCYRPKIVLVSCVKIPACSIVLFIVNSESLQWFIAFKTGTLIYACIHPQKTRNRLVLFYLNALSEPWMGWQYMTKSWLYNYNTTISLLCNIEQSVLISWVKSKLRAQRARWRCLHSVKKKVLPLLGCRTYLDRLVP